MNHVARKLKILGLILLGTLPAGGCGGVSDIVFGSLQLALGIVDVAT